MRRARLRMLFRRAMALVDAVAQQQGLSPAQYHVLLALAAGTGDGGMAESELVRYLEASRAHVSVLVRRLVDGGLVCAWRSPDDRRHLHLAVTPHGWGLLHALGERQEEVLQRFVADVNADEVAAIVREIAGRYLGIGLGETGTAQE